MGSHDYGQAAEFIAIYQKREGKYKLPWTRAYNNIMERCRGKQHRVKHLYSGIGCDIKPSELRELFFRDKAYLMKQPSVDRINPDGNYEATNVQWIEFKENRKKRAFSDPARAEGYKTVSDGLINLFEKQRWLPHIRKNFINKFRKDQKLTKSKAILKTEY